MGVMWIKEWCAKASVTEPHTHNHVPKYVEAHISFQIDVGMVHLCFTLHFWRVVGISQANLYRSAHTHAHTHTMKINQPQALLFPRVVQIWPKLIYKRQTNAF